MQDKKVLDEFYATADPWGYQTNPEDLKRKQRILDVLKDLGPFERALDIGAGEGWITKDLPAKIKHAFELSEEASKRFPFGVEEWSNAPVAKEYDLVTATGVLYAQYNWEAMVSIAKNAASKIILTCHIKSAEISYISKDPWWNSRQFYEEEFPYREYTQKLRIFNV